MAWFDLGRVQLRNNEPAPARHSFEQAIAADPKYVNPYRGIAELETRQKQWPELVKVTGQVLALNPVNFPDAWLLNALGNYYLHNFPEAEKSARQGMKVDDQHQVPKLEYLLGMILAQKREYPEAASTSRIISRSLPSRQRSPTPRSNWTKSLACQRRSPVLPLQRKSKSRKSKPETRRPYRRHPRPVIPERA